MAFTVPDEEPARATGLAAGDTIEASSMQDVVLRDRFLFAMRRRVLASLQKVVTSSPGGEIAYNFQAKTLPTATDTIIVGVVANDDCRVDVITAYGTVSIGTGGPGCYIDALSGIPQDTWFEVTVEVQSNTGGAVIIYGIYIAEQVLTAADLP